MDYVIYYVMATSFSILYHCNILLCTTSFFLFGLKSRSNGSFAEALLARKVSQYEVETSD